MDPQRYECRIPYEFFVTTGAGQSSLDSGETSFETGSYDLALEDAGIENFNIVEYSSVVPKEATQLTFDEAKKRFHHGAVLECIMASMNGAQGDHICVGVGRIKINVPSLELQGIGFAAEYEGHASPEKAKDLLTLDLTGIVKRRYAGHQFDVVYEQFDIKDLVVDKAYGTVLAALCFISHLYPEKKQQ